MLLVRATTLTGRDLLCIGLSAANRRRIDTGLPVAVSAYTNVDQQGPLQIVIFAGETEDTMVTQLPNVLEIARCDVHAGAAR